LCLKSIFRCKNAALGVFSMQRACSVATIDPRQDKDGITAGWQAIVREKGYPSQTRTFRTKRDAEAWARSIESQMDRKIWKDTSAAERTTLAECLDRYAGEILPDKKSTDRSLDTSGSGKPGPLPANS